MKTAGERASFSITTCADGTSEDGSATDPDPMTEAAVAAPEGSAAVESVHPLRMKQNKAHTSAAPMAFCMTAPII